MAWHTSDKIKIIKNILKEPKDKFTESVAYKNGGNKLELLVNNMPAPSITFLRIEKTEGTGIKTLKHIDKKNILYQNYPNPFNSQTKISFDLCDKKEANLLIFNIKGEIICDFKIKNNKNIIWNGKDRFGKAVPSGIYFYRLKAGEYFSQTKKMIFLK